jgi:hypothetical protein
MEVIYSLQSETNIKMAVFWDVAPWCPKVSEELTAFIIRVLL